MIRESKRSILLRITNYFLLITGFLAATIFVTPAFAQATTPTVDPGTIPDDAVNAIAQDMFCPVCESTPLDVCGTQACHQWRELIRQLLAEGQTEEQIKAYFVEQYGDRVLAEPPARGFNWLVYVIPPFAFVVGAFFVFRVMRSWRAATPAMSADMPTVDDEYVQRLEEELEKRA